MIILFSYLRKAYRLMGILSLDVVGGAVVGTCWVASLCQVSLPWPVPTALGLSIWLIYTFDHLLDAFRLQHPATLPRHRFHQRYHRPLRILFGAAALCLTRLLFLLPLPLLGWGAGLAFGLVVYFLVFVWQKRNPGKEFTISLVYAIGILLPSLVLLEGRGLGLLPLYLLAQYTGLALVNLLFLALLEAPADQADGFPSLVSYWGATKTRNLVVTLLLLGSLGTGASLGYLPGSWIFGGMWIAFSLLTFLKNYFTKTDHYRYLADGIFLLPLLDMVK